MRKHVTKRTIDALTPGSDHVFLWDDELPGFGVRCSPAGVKSFVLQYSAGTGRGAPRRRFTIGRYGPWTPEAARKEATRLRAEIDRGFDPLKAKAAAREAPSVTELCEQYLSEGTVTKKPSTVRSDRGRIRHHIIPLLGRKRVDALTRADVDRLMLDVQSGKTAKPLESGEKRPVGSVPKGGPGAAAQCVILLGTIFAFATRRGLRADNPAHGIKKPKARKMERFLSEHEIGRLAEALNEYEARGGNPYATAAIRLLMLTGARRSEVLTLKWREHVDLDRAVLFLSDSKTGRKPVYLNTAAIQVLRSIPKVDGNPYVIIGDRLGSHYVGIDKVWTAVRAAAALADVRIHDLRHSYASVGAAGGLSLPVIGALLGHKDTATTARYAHLSADPLRAANEAIGAQISHAMKADTGASHE
jgi:integrase